jgi:xanthine phosphoribosyltransferase
MKLLEEKILSEGTALYGGVIKVDGFLNRQIDVKFIKSLAEEWYNAFKNDGITKIVTIESSGIALASITALEFGVPMIFAKKTSGAPSGSLSVKVVSFTHGNNYYVSIPKELISPDDKILIIDDLIANGSAVKSLVKVCESGGAKVSGIGIAIEKAFQSGASDLREKGYKIEALARIKRLGDDGSVEFC